MKAGIQRCFLNQLKLLSYDLLEFMGEANYSFWICWICWMLAFASLFLFFRYFKIINMRMMLTMKSAKESNANQPPKFFTKLCITALDLMLPRIRTAIIKIHAAKKQINADFILLLTFSMSGSVLFSLFSLSNVLLFNVSTIFCFSYLLLESIV